MSDEETTPLAKVLDLTTRMFQDIRGDLSGLKADLTKVQADVTKVQADLTTLRGDMNERFEQVDRRFDAGEKRSRAFEDVITLAVSGLRVDLMQVNGRLERLEAAAGKAGLL